MEKPLLSVIVPIYNVEKYIERCLDSIINQTYSNIEIICISDGNTDKSNEIIKNKYLKDRRIRLIEKENGGLVSVRKRGLQEAKGDYVTHVDGDDWIERNMYSELMQLACEHDADIVTSGEIRDYGDYIVESNESVAPGLYEGESLCEIKRNLIRTDVFYKSTLSAHQWNKIYKKVAIEQIQYEADNNCSYGEDAVVVYPAIYSAKKIVVSGKNYYHYCLRSDSMGGIIEEKNKEQIIAFSNNIKMSFFKYGCNIDNIFEQANRIIMYVKLLRDVSNVVKYEDGRLYPFGELCPEERIAIYGAGKFGKFIKELIEHRFKMKNVEWIDSTGTNGAQSIDEVELSKYDKILVAVLLFDVYENIAELLLDRGVNKKKIIGVNIEG